MVPDLHLWVVVHLVFGTILLKVSSAPVDYYQGFSDLFNAIEILWNTLDNHSRASSSSEVRVADSREDSKLQLVWSCAREILWCSGMIKGALLFHQFPSLEIGHISAIWIQSKWNRFSTIISRLGDRADWKDIYVYVYIHNHLLSLGKMWHCFHSDWI